MSYQCTECLSVKYVQWCTAECPICLSGFKDPVKTKCGHSFCRGCINEAVQHSPYCPSCKTAIRTIVGSQPNGGKMTVKVLVKKIILTFCIYNSYSIPEASYQDIMIVGPSRYTMIFIVELKASSTLILVGGSRVPTGQPISPIILRVGKCCSCSRGHLMPDLSSQWAPL